MLHEPEICIKLLSFKLKNIKSFENSGEIEIKPITLFVGRNSCGKSSLLRFLPMLKQTFKYINAVEQTYSVNALQLSGVFVDYGAAEQIVHRGFVPDVYDDVESQEREKVFSYTFKFEVTRNFYNFIVEKHELSEKEISDLKEYFGFDGTDFNIESEKNTITSHYELEKTECQIFDLEIAFQVTDNRIVYDSLCLDNENTGTRLKINFPVKNRKPSCECFSSEEKEIQHIKAVIENTWSRWKDSRPDPCYVEDHNDLMLYCEDESDYKSILSELRDILSWMEKGFENVNYIGPIRNRPEKVYLKQYCSYNYVGVHGEHFPPMLAADKGVLQKVNSWMKGAFDKKVMVKNLDEDVFKLYIVDNNNVATNIVDNGYGLSQILPIATQILYHSFYDENIIAIEQPELHLHPAAQSSIADLLTCKLNPRFDRRRIICETHSEHIIRKLQVLVADKDNSLTKDDVIIYYVDKIDGKALVKEMKMNDNGQFLEEWPEGFFDLSFNLSLELLKKIK